MSGVWVFNRGVARLVSNPHVENMDVTEQHTGSKRKVLVYRPSNHIISSYAELEARLATIGWSRYPHEQPGTLQFHKGHSSNLLITLPREFRQLKPMHLFDISMKIRDYFEVRDV